MKDWFSSSELAGVGDLPNSVRAVQMRAKNAGWMHRKRKGRGGGREYHIDSLPAATVAALLRAHGTEEHDASSTPKPEQCPRQEFNYSREDLSRWAASRPQEERDEGARRARVLLDAMRLVEQSGLNTRDALASAADAWSLPRGTVKNWYYGNGKPGARHYERCDWAYALMDQHQGRTSTAECDPTAWQFYRGDYLRPEQPTHAACYRRLRDAAAEHDWCIPSAKTLRRRMEREVPYTLRVLLRQGEHELMRRFPSQQRTVRELRALQWINGDGYTHNVFVEWPDGSIARPKTWFWQDVYSRRFLAHRTDQTEHSGLIMLATGDVLDRWGIPDHATIDNTRAAANKYLTGGVPHRYRFRVQEGDVMGLLPTLGVDVHWTGVVAGKGWGQAKPVERQFKSIGGIGDDIDKDPRLAGAYTGASVDAKPDNYRSKAIPLETFLQVLDEGVRRWNAEPKRRTEICAGELSYDQAFRQSYERYLYQIPKPTESQRRQWLMAAEQIVVAKDGTVSLQIGKGPDGRNRYGSDQLLEHKGRRVVVRFDPGDLHAAVHCYTSDGRYLGVADCIHAAGFGDADAGREWQRQRKRRVKATKDAAAAEQRMSALEIGSHMPQSGDEEEPVQGNVVRGVFTSELRAMGNDDDVDDFDFQETFAQVVEQLRTGDD